jgi:hypothetical protein
MGWGVGAMGTMAAMSGLLGFCPACAMVGRKNRLFPPNNDYGADEASINLIRRGPTSWSALCACPKCT